MATSTGSTCESSKLDNPVGNNEMGRDLVSSLSRGVLWVELLPPAVDFDASFGRRVVHW